MEGLWKLTFLLLVFSVSLGEAKIDAKLLRELKKFRVDILVNFVNGNSPVINEIKGKSFPTRVDRVKTLNDKLQQLANSKQGPVKDFLNSQNLEYESFWSSNQMVVRQADLPTVQAIAAFKQVSRVQKLPIGVLAPIQSKVVPTLGSVQWGVAKIQADLVWSEFAVQGKDVVVANIDTGVRSTHEALAANFRSDHGWFDPYTNTTVPDDGNGHGSHTMGTIAGLGGIGVAPAAKWIACRGCGSSSCDGAKLLACGQWMLQPTQPDGTTDPDPTKIPDVISNSWGSNIGNDPWYNATVEAWGAAGILHAFAIGNSGPFCKSGGSPGDQPKVFSVGSTDSNDQLSRFSSKGPAGTSITQIIKPDIAAPGSNVYSAWYSADNAYNTISGTSMATPHVAGVMALMLSAHRQQVGSPAARLSQDQIVAYIEQTADTQGLSLGWNLPCGSTSSKPAYPNNQFGYGRINALKAVNATVNPSPSVTSAPQIFYV